MLNVLNRRIRLYGSMVLVALGIAAYATGLHGEFLGDDTNQIVKNVPVHSITNAAQFFLGSTFYNGGADAPLTGGYYRPLMTLFFSALYSLFGPDPYYFHLFQLLLHIACAIILFLVLLYLFRPPVALALAAIWLVHPINSQSVYAVASLQEPLFFLFGILAVYFLVRFQDKSRWYLVITALCLTLSLLSKESGILFAGVIIAYALLADRKRWKSVLFAVMIPLVIFAVMRLHAIGLVANPHNVPIDALGLGARLLNVPSIIWHYLYTALMPLALAHGYYWAHTRVTLQGFFLPLVGVVVVVGSLIWPAIQLRRRGLHRELILYSFFGIWLGLGLLLHMQIVPLDFTVSETWFYFPLVGLLGLAGVAYEAFAKPRYSKWAVAVVVVIIVAFSVRTAVRGQDWQDYATLAYHDVQVSTDDFHSENDIAHHLAVNGNLEAAKSHALRSIQILPTYNNYNSLGIILVGLKDYQGAQAAFLNGLKYHDSYVLYENLASLAVRYGDAASANTIIQSALKKFPQDGTLWYYLAINRNQTGDNPGARQALEMAKKYTAVSDAVAQKIENGETVPEK